MCIYDVHKYINTYILCLYTERQGGRKVRERMGRGREIDGDDDDDDDWKQIR